MHALDSSFVLNISSSGMNANEESRTTTKESSLAGALRIEDAKKPDRNRSLHRGRFSPTSTGSASFRRRRRRALLRRFSGGYPFGLRVLRHLC